MIQSNGFTFVNERGEKVLSLHDVSDELFIVSHGFDDEEFSVTPEELVELANHLLQAAARLRRLELVEGNQVQVEPAGMGPQPAFDPMDQFKYTLSETRDFGPRLGIRL